MGDTNKAQLPAEQLADPDAAVRSGNATKPNPESKLRVDGEVDTLYDDGLSVGDDSETLADTHGERGTGG